MNSASQRYTNVGGGIEERNAAGTVLATYVHGVRQDEMLTRTTSAGTVYYHHNALGSVTDLTNASGAVVEKYKYDAFGKPAITDGSGNPLTASAYGNRFLFTGREYLAEISLYDYRNRVYSAELGRFLQTDPERFSAEDVNIYRYCGNNPLNGTDAMGLSWGSNALTFVGVAAFTAAAVVAAPEAAVVLGGVALATGIGALASYATSGDAASGAAGGLVGAGTLLATENPYAAGAAAGATSSALGSIGNGDPNGVVVANTILGGGAGAATGGIGPTIAEGLSGSEADNVFADLLGNAVSNLAGITIDWLSNLFETAAGLNCPLQNE